MDSLVGWNDEVEALSIAKPAPGEQVTVNPTAGQKLDISAIAALDAQFYQSAANLWIVFQDGAILVVEDYFEGQTEEASGTPRSIIDDGDTFTGEAFLTAVAISDLPEEFAEGDTGDAGQQRNGVSFDDPDGGALGPDGPRVIGLLDDTGLLLDDDAVGIETTGFTDDEPTIVGEILDGAIDEDALETDGVAVAEGSLNIDFGFNSDDVADGVDAAGDPIQDLPTGAGNRSVVFSSDAVGADGPLASGDVPLDLVLSAGGTVLTATAGPGGDTVFEVRLFDDDAGSYRFTLFGPLDHPDATSEDDLTLTFNFTATDANGDSVLGAFSVIINDDVPEVDSDANARIVLDDDDVGSDGNPGFGANTTDGAESDAIARRATGQLDHEFGADQAGATLEWTGGTSVRGGASDVEIAVDPVTQDLVISQLQDGKSTVVARIELDAATGGYTAIQLQNLLHRSTANNNENNQVFELTYRVTDGDGDTADGTIQVTIDDDSPIASFSGRATLVEEADATGAFLEKQATGTLQFEGGADGATVTAIEYAFFAGTTAQINDGVDNGEGFSLVDLESGGVPVEITSSDGGLTLTGMAGATTVFVFEVTDANSGDYTFTQSAPLDHPELGNIGVDDTLRMRFDFTITDGDGDTASSHLVIDINDDGPTASFSGRTILAEEADATGAFVPSIDTGTLQFEGGGDGATVTAIEYAFFAGTTAQINDGVDNGEGFNLIDLESGGVPVEITSSNGGLTLTGMAGATTVFVFEVTDANSGDYTFTQSAPLDHPELGNIGVDDTLRMRFDFTITDGDGDTASSHLVIDINDDGPEVSNPEGSAPGVSNAQLDEDDIIALDGVQPAGNDGTGPTEASGNLKVDFGADGFGALTFSGAFNIPTVGSGPANPADVATGVPSGLTSDGREVLFRVVNDGATLEAFVEGTEEIIFDATLDQDSDAGYTVHLFGNIDHASGKDAQSINLAFVATDFDDDSVDLILSLRLTDDVPTASFSSRTTVDESTDSTGAFVPSIDTGTLQFDGGADGAVVTAIEHQSGTVDGQSAAFDPDEPSPPVTRVKLTSGGEEITIEQTDALTLTGKTATQDIFTIKVTDAAAGAYEVKLLGPIDHPDKGESGAADPLRLKVGFTVTDGDGDTASQSFQVDFTDDAPVIDAGEIENGIVEEEQREVVGAGIDDTSGDGDADGFFNRNRTTDETDGSLGISWGADDGDARTLVFDKAQVEADLSGLSSRGDLVELSFSEDGTQLNATADGRPVFTVSLSEDDSGSYTFTLLDTLDHPVDAQGEDSLALTLAFIATDSDGDEARESFIINVIDDQPVVDGPLPFLQNPRFVEEEDLTGGNEDGEPLLIDTGSAIIGQPLTDKVVQQDLNIRWGADDTDKADTLAGGILVQDNTNTQGERSLTFADNPLPDANLKSRGKDVTVELSEDKITIKGFVVGEDYAANNPVFTVALSDDESGSYTFVLQDVLDHPTKGSSAAEEDTISLRFDFVASDGDGDTDAGSFVVGIVDDSPVANDDSLLVDEDGTNVVALDVLANDVFGADGPPDSDSVTLDTSATIGIATLNADNTVSYDPNGQFDSLAVGETATDTFRYTITDGDGDTSAAEVTVTITGTNDAPVITQANTSGSVHEPGAFSTNINGTSISFNPALGESGEFRISGAGIGGSQMFDALDDLVEALADIANGSRVGGNSLPDAGPASGGFPNIISTAGGLLSLGGRSVAGTVQYQFPSESAALDFLNEVLTPLYDQINQADSVASATELTESGVIKFTDVDLTDTHIFSATPNDATNIGTMTVGLNNGREATGGNTGEIAWRYSVNPDDLNFLAEGETREEAFTVAIDDQKGGVVSQVVKVTQVGANDVPVLSVTRQNNHDETTDISNITTTINATFTDVDVLDNGHVGEVFLKRVSGKTGGMSKNDFAALDLLKPGSVVISDATTDGTITFDFLAESTVFDYLAEGETVTLNYRLTVEDEHGGRGSKEVDITITGTNDDPVIVSPTKLTGSVSEATSFSFGQDTNGGANGFAYNADTNVFSIGGQGVGGTQTFSELNPYLDRAAEAFSGTVETAGNINPIRIADGDVPNIRRVQPGSGTDWNVVLSGSGVGGTQVWSFASEAHANTFNAFLTRLFDEIDNADAIAFGDTDTTTSDTLLTAGGNVTFEDVDINDTHTVEIVEAWTTGAGGFRGEIDAQITDTVGTDGEGKVRWEFTVPDDDLNDLAKGESVEQTYTLTIRDAAGATDIRTVKVTLNGGNDIPQPRKVTFSVDETTDTSDITATRTVNFDDADLNDVGHTASVNVKSRSGDTSGISSLTNTDLEGLISFGAVNKNAGDTSGSVPVTFTAGSTTFDYLSDGDFARITYRVVIDDGDGGSKASEFEVTINGTNDAPVVAPIVVDAVSEDDAVQVINLLAGASDVEGDTLSVTIIAVIDSLDQDVIFTDNGDGTISINPNQYDSLNDGESRTITVNYDVSDGTDTTPNTATVTIEGVTDIAIPAGVYGSKLVNSTGPSDYSIELNANALSDMNNANGLFAIGGERVRGNGATFSGSSSDSNVLLELTIEGAAGPTSLAALDNGWYDNSGVHRPGNPNIFVGVSGTRTLRNFFVFDLEDIDSNIVEATLHVAGGFNQGSGVYVLNAVSTPIPSLIEGTGGLPAFNDLGGAGSGTPVYDSDPIIVDLDGDGAETIAASAGVAFDLDADGDADQIGWVAPDDGMLVVDTDGSGAIEDGSEVFSEVFEGGTYDNSLEALRTMDSNGDGILDAADARFAQIKVWQDADSDGKTDVGELKTLDEHGIASLDLNASDVNTRDNGNLVFAGGEFTKTDGGTGSYVGVVFGSSANDAAPVSNDDVILAKDGVVDIVALDETSAGATILEFNTSEDRVDLTALLDGAAKPSVRVEGSNTIVSVDADGPGAAGAQDVAILAGITSGSLEIIDDGASTQIAIASS